MRIRWQEQTCGIGGAMGKGARPEQTEPVIAGHRSESEPWPVPGENVLVPPGATIQAMPRQRAITRRKATLWPFRQ